LKLLIDLAALVVGGVIASTEYAFEVLGAVLARAEMSRVGASTFDAPGLKMAVVPGMAVPLAIRALSYCASRFGGFKCYLALLQVLHLKDFFVVEGGLKVDEEHRKWELGAVVRDVPNVGDLVAEFFDFSLDVGSWY
jgi:hypothetical protein